MTKDFISLNLDVTVSETVEILKEMKPDEEEMYYIYITDNEDRIKGVISLRNLILSPGNEKLKNIMSENFQTLQHEDGIESAIELSSKYDLLSVPVVDEKEILVGIIIIHDIIDEYLYPTWKKKNRKLKD